MKWIDFSPDGLAYAQAYIPEKDEYAHILRQDKDTVNVHATGGKACHFYTLMLYGHAGLL